MDFRRFSNTLFPSILPVMLFRPSGSQGNAVRTDQYATCIMRTVAILLATLTPYQPTETVIIPAVKKVHTLFTDRPKTEDYTGAATGRVPK